MWDVGCRERRGTGDQTHLLDDGVCVGGVERLLELVALGELALGDVYEHVRDLEDVIDVGLDAAPPFLHFVLVACNLYPTW